MASTEHPNTAQDALSQLAALAPSRLTAPESRKEARADWPVVVTSQEPAAFVAEPCDHAPPVDGRYVSVCCTAYGIGHVDDGDAKLGILPTGVCCACNDHAVFAVECRYCHEIVDALTGKEVG